jgi:hypothetical protein
MARGVQYSAARHGTSLLTLSQRAAGLSALVLQATGVALVLKRQRHFMQQDAVCCHTSIVRSCSAWHSALHARKMPAPAHSRAGAFAAGVLEGKGKLLCFAVLCCAGKGKLSAFS